MALERLKARIKDSVKEELRRESLPIVKEMKELRRELSELNKNIVRLIKSMEGRRR